MRFVMAGGRARRLRLRPPLAAVAAVLASIAIRAAFAPVDATSYGPLVECPPPVPTLQSLISMGAYLDGPLAGHYGNPAVNEGPLGCLAGMDLAFVSFRSAPEGLGGAYAYAVEPDWMDTWQQTRRFLTPTDAEIGPGFGAGPFLAVAVPPDLQARFDGLAGQWVSVRGHFDDAAATTCRMSGNPKPRAGEIPTNVDLIEMCRTSFVVTGIAPIDRPCLTGKIDWAAISATPEPMRARCFGRAPLSFVANGFSINNTWNLAVPPVQDWELLDPAGGSDEAAERSRALEAFVPNDLVVPNPVDAPWHDRDGVGGFDVRWRVVGHFDDPAAEACRADPEGFILDGRHVGWSDDDALAFCRNHLFVDSLEWIRDPAPSASTAGAAPDAPSAIPHQSIVPGGPAGPPVVTSGPDPAIVAAAGVALAIGLVLASALVRRRRA